MAIELDNNTVVRILVRRGTDADRQNVILAQGELAYTIDTERLFIGNNDSGTVAGNKFLGTVANLNSLNSSAQNGDYAIDAINSAMFIAQVSGQNVNWVSTLPNLVNLEYIPEGLAISTDFAGTGFNIDYSGTGQLELDSNYWFLSTFGLTINGSVATQSANCQAILSAGDAPSLHFINDPSTPYLTSYINAASSLVIRTHGSVLSSSPALDIYAPWMRVNGNLMVTGSAFFANAQTLATQLLQVSSIMVDISNHPSLTGVRITSNDSSTTNAVLFQIDNANSPLVYANNNGFVGIHTNKFSLPAYQTFKTVISGRSLIDGSLTLNGDLSATGDIIAFYTSDSNLKENIKPITNALEKLSTLEGVEFDWLEHTLYSGHDVGVIAQQVEKIYPEAVRERFDGYKSVAYHKIIPLLIQAIKELAQKNG